MNEILLQTIIDKLESLEKSNIELSGKGNAVNDYSPELENINELIKKIHSEIHNIPSQIYFPSDEIYAHRIAMKALTEQLRQPVQQRERHIHYLSKPILACIVLVAIIIGLSVWVGQLYEYIHEKELEKSFQTIIVPATDGQGKLYSKPHRSKRNPYINIK
ncbi:MAG: hypothetical protein NVS1B13_00380 [Flavisolibacter sp.]